MPLLSKPARSSHSNTTSIIICCIAFTIIAAAASSVYRGIYPDDLPRYSRWAEAIFSEHGLRSDNPDSIASVLYHALIALAYALVGNDLIAVHLFPYLFAVFTPMMMFLLLRQITRHSFWACAGTLIYMAFPTNFIWTNQPLTEPLFLFCLIVTMYGIELAKERPQFMVLVGIAAACMSLARLFDGFLYATLAGIALVIQHRKHFPVKWGLGAIIAFFGTHFLASLLFHYSLLQYYDYYLQMLHYPYEHTSPIAKTVAAIKIFMRWYFGGPLLTPFFIIVLMAGLMYTLRKNVVSPVIFLAGYASFILFVYQGRYVDTFDLRLGVKMVPSLTIMFISGVKWGYDSLLAEKKRWNMIAAYVFGIMMFALFGIVAIQQNTLFLRYMTDIIPSSSLLEIIRHRPVYEQARREIAAKAVQNSGGTGKEFREEVIKVVLGDYRPSYRSKLAEQAWKNGLPALARQEADFSYHGTFDNEQWKEAAFRVEGTSALWTAAHPGRIGAFPAGSEGTVIFKFALPRYAKKITISDIHTQWSAGDVVRMWISYNARDWILQYDDNIRYQKAYYHHDIEHLSGNISEIYVKYYFLAGDMSRVQNDNRGASLEEFSIAVILNKS